MVGAKELIVEFLSAMDDELSVQQLLRVASAFDVSESSLRVALVRLRNRGRVISPRRGVYALGDAARPLHQRVVSWRETDRLVREWDGSWVAASFSEIGDRTELRHAQRALKLWGFRELRPRLAIRPNNLAIDLDELRQRVHRLGLSAGFLFVMSHLGDEDVHARRLWNDAGLDDAYEEVLDAMRASRARLLNRSLPSSSLDDAVRESFVVGREAIRLLVLDPLLPEPLVDAAKRESVRRAMLEYDCEGRELWRRFILDERRAA